MLRFEKCKHVTVLVNIGTHNVLLCIFANFRFNCRSQALFKLSLISDKMELQTFNYSDMQNI